MPTASLLTLALLCFLAFAGCTKKEAPTAVLDTAAGKYQVGDKWKFQARPGEDNAALTVVKVESNPKVGTIVHISIEGVHIKNPRSTNGFNETVAHMPFAEDAIEKSVTRLIAKGSPLPPFEDGYWQWRTAFENNQGGVFYVTVGEGLDFLEKGLNQ